MIYFICWGKRRAPSIKDHQIACMGHVLGQHKIISKSTFELMLIFEHMNNLCNHTNDMSK